MVYNVIALCTSSYVCFCQCHWGGDVLGMQVARSSAEGNEDEVDVKQEEQKLSKRQQKKQKRLEE